MTKYLVLITIIAIPASALSQTEEDCADIEEALCVYTESTESGASVIGWNRGSYDVTVEFEFQLNNMEVEGDEATMYVVEPDGKKLLTSLLIKDLYQGSSYQYAFTWTPGDVFAQHNDNVLYQLPYEIGKTYYVGQSCKSQGTHSKKHSEYAIDFALPVGTPIHAARGGTVIDLHELSNSGGLSAMHLHKGNFVQIEHDDGTFAAYHHMRTMGVKVAIGDRINTGDFIGYSGNTGYSSGPHLHFVVMKPESSRSSISIPVKWQAKRGVLSCPEAGKALKAVPVSN